ncbi:MAG: signal recognition particle-docking protein FtsY [Sumerlaeia bacterium]
MTEEQEPKKRKPGFFTNLFNITNTEDPEVVPPVEEPADSTKDDQGFFGNIFKTKSTEEVEQQKAMDKAAEAAAERAFGGKKSFFKRLRERLRFTRRSLFEGIRAALGLSGKLDEETIEEIEAVLLQSDVSMQTTMKIVDKMQKEATKRGDDMSPEEMLQLFRKSVQDILEQAAPGFNPVPPNPGEPYVVMMIGVNGVGKTTTVAKMAKRCTDAGLKTMLVAGDTFRAAAVEQLELWSQRIGCEFMKAPQNSDAAALCYNALQKAKASGVQVVFIDTAGRLHTKSSLMDELVKINRVIKKQIPEAPHETLLVIDATTGQNALSQVKTFHEQVPISGLVMTKLDGTAKGGILLSILDQFHIPITLIGVGEAAEDLRDFDPEEYAAALFGE